jgi:preprotein translocase subunit SecF
MKIIPRRKIWFSLSGLLVVLSIAALSLWGINLGIDFTGGSSLEVTFEGERPGVVDIQQRLSDLNLGNLVVKPVDDDGMILRFQETEEQVHQQVMEKLGAGAVQERFDSVGPSIGDELKRKSFYAVAAVLVAIIAYIAWAFRKVSRPVASWKYGMTAIIALFHDAIIVLGAFAVLGHFMDIEINTAFIAAILTVLGYSVNDSIVVFDRIRENLPYSEQDFEGTIDTSVNQTITRSLYTSATTTLVLVSILILGGPTITGFVAALLVGILIGTYSSIFLASPLLVMWKEETEA